MAAKKVKANICRADVESSLDLNADADGENCHNWQKRKSGNYHLCIWMGSWVTNEIKKNKQMQIGSVLDVGGAISEEVQPALPNLID